MKICWVVLLVLTTAGILGAEAMDWTVDRTEIVLPSIIIERPETSERISTANATRNFLSKDDRSVDSAAVSATKPVESAAQPITASPVPQK
ncbi:hypothetical protein JW992_02405 [candidate division KSB1 bacterium]|nr:hypothetical protein [candidate division KSB1 bacterium]